MSSHVSSRSVIVVLTVLLALAVGRMSATGKPAAAVPTAMIATVDLDVVFKNLKERPVREAEWKAHAESRQAELKKIEVELQGMATKLETADVAERRALNAAILEKEATAQVKKQLFQREIDQRRGELFSAILTKIKAAAARLAVANGYTLVLTSDENATIPTDASSADVQRAVLLRRMLYVAKEHDVSDDLWALMNNEWEAGGGK